MFGKPKTHKTQLEFDGKILGETAIQVADKWFLSDQVELADIPAIK